MLHRWVSRLHSTRTENEVPRLATGFRHSSDCQSVLLSDGHWIGAPTCLGFFRMRPRRSKTWRRFNGTPRYSVVELRPLWSVTKSNTRCPSGVVSNVADKALKSAACAPLLSQNSGRALAKRATATSRLPDGFPRTTRPLRKSTSINASGDDAASPNTSMG